METVLLRRCETCVYHLPGESPCTGRCAHPGWQPTADAIRYVRARECACYGGWGTDFWRPRPNNGGGGPSGPGGPAGGPGGGPAVDPTLAGGRIISLIPREDFERLYPSRAQLIQNRLRPSDPAAIADDRHDGV